MTDQTPSTSTTPPQAPVRPENTLSGTFDEANRRFPKPSEPTALGSMMQGAGQWFDLLSLMIRDPERYELMSVVYGYRQGEGADTGPPSWLEEPWQQAEALQSQYGDRLSDQQIVEIVNGTPLGEETLLRPDLLAAAQQNPQISQTLDEIVHQVTLYNQQALIQGSPMLDPYLTANWLWTKTGLNPGHADPSGHIGIAGIPAETIQSYGQNPQEILADPQKSIAMAVAHIGNLTAVTGNQYLAIMNNDGGGFSADTDGDGTIDHTGILEETAARLGLESVQDINPVQYSHLQALKAVEAERGLSGVYDGILANNSAFWDESVRSQALAGMQAQNHQIPDAFKSDQDTITTGLAPSSLEQATAGQ